MLALTAKQDRRGEAWRIKNRSNGSCGALRSGTNGGTNIPTRIEDDPTVAAIMEAEKLDAYRMKSKPTKTIIVNSPMKGASDAS